MAASKTNGKLVRIPSSRNMNRVMKTVKMVRAKCVEHQAGYHRFNTDWIEVCKAEGHDPFVTVKQKRIVTPVTEVREDGKTYLVKEDIAIEQVSRPNWVEVPDEHKLRGGRGVAIALQQGWKYPEELGYAPFCDFKGCWEQNPKFQTRAGKFHQRDEAALIVLRAEETPVYVPVGVDQRRRAAQLSAVQL
jgi:hypothetical protein